MSINIGGKNYESLIDQKASQNINMYHIAGRSEDYEPARNNNFEFYVPDFDGLTNFENPSRTFSNTQEIIRFAVESAPVPSYSVSEVSIQRGNSAQYFANLPKFQSGQLTLIDYIGTETKSILRSWLAKASNIKTGKTGIASDYKRNCLLIEYSPDGRKLREWTMYGCWVTNVNEQPFNHADGGIRKITATIRYDYAIPETESSGESI